MKVALCCVAGMSTSIYMRKMKNYANENGIDLEIAVYGVGDIADVWRRYDVILLGPQISNLKKKLGETINKPILVISPANYGLYQVDEVFKEIKEVLGEG